MYLQNLKTPVIVEKDVIQTHSRHKGKVTNSQKLKVPVIDGEYIIRIYPRLKGKDDVSLKAKGLS